VRKLTTEMLLTAYCSGAFPMAVNARGDIRWFAPDPRGIIPLDERFHIPHGLKRTLKKQPFTITADQDFELVMRHCSTAHGETWISGEIIRAYCELHELGFAHSLEARLDGVLVGGLYGVHIRGAFFGESMFHHATDASKCALVALVERLRAGGFTLLDTQWTTPHLDQFGACEIPQSDYNRLLQEALQLDCSF
jgi:leucyl/phenylalanyl-tRNA---protein transferase